MSEARFESIAEELRVAAPPAPERLRNLVHTLPSAQQRLALRLRPALSIAIAIAIAVGLGAALIGGLKDSQTPTGGGSFGSYAGSRSPDSGSSQRSLAPKALTGSSAHSLQDHQRFAPTLAPGSRLQQYDASMNLRVRDLSRGTQAAVRQTRRLGGYVAAANYSTGGNTGDSSLDLRVPVQHVQEAIAGFTDFGTILSQRISVGDLQAPLDRTDARIAALRKQIARLEVANDPRLAGVKRTLQRLIQSRSNLVHEGTYAKISLQLTTRTPAAKHVAPGRFDRFWGDAGDILGKEAIAVLYALVVAGPFAILAALGMLAGRARRRRADHRLLEETG